MNDDDHHTETGRAPDSVGAPHLRTAWRTVPTAGGLMKTYVARPDAPVDRAVVVLQEAFGVNDHVQDIARRLAARGYLALAPQLFHRTDTDVVGYADHPQAMALISALGPDQIISDVQGALAHLHQDEGIELSRTVVVGFCFGGRAAFTATTASPGLGAAAVFYGPGIARGPHAVLDRAGAVTTPVIMHVGADDPTIPASDVSAIDTAMTNSSAEFVQHVYPGAGHAFACDARPHMYRPDAAAAAWARTHEFLDRHVPHASHTARP